MGIIGGPKGDAKEPMALEVEQFKEFQRGCNVLNKLTNYSCVFCYLAIIGE